MEKKPRKRVGSILKYGISALILCCSILFYQKSHNPQIYAAIIHQLMDVLPNETASGGPVVPEGTSEPVEPSSASSSPDNTLMVNTQTNETTLIGGSYNIVYYNQQDVRWKDKIYGKSDSIGVYGCGPTTLAMVVSSLTNTQIQPPEMAAWACEHGFFCEGSGSYHSIIPKGAKNFGLQVHSLSELSKDAIIQELNTGHILVALVKQGSFTSSSGHFILIRSVTLDGNVLVADPQSLDHSIQAWNIETILTDLKTNASAGGPLWSISSMP